jgi:hypothetical protein
LPSAALVSVRVSARWGEDPPEVALVGGTQAGKQLVRAVGAGGVYGAVSGSTFVGELDQSRPSVGGVRCPPSKAFLHEAVDEDGDVPGRHTEPIPQRRHDLRTVFGDHMDEPHPGIRHPLHQDSGVLPLQKRRGKHRVWNNCAQLVGVAPTADPGSARK